MTNEQLKENVDKMLEFSYGLLGEKNNPSTVSKFFICYIEQLKEITAMANESDILKHKYELDAILSMCANIRQYEVEYIKRKEQKNG